MSVLIDGAFASTLPADDRGFLFGETVFETIAFCDRQAPLWPLHWQRLAFGAERLGLDLPPAELWLQDCLKLGSESGRHVLRLTLSAGSGGNGYWPAEWPEPRRVVSRRAWPAGIDEQRQAGLRLRLSSIQLSVEGHTGACKHGNRLSQVLAARECRQSGHEEAILLDPDGFLVEAISSNLLLVLNDSLLTPERPVVAGVGLAWLRTQAGSRLIEAALPASRLAECSEVMVINSVAGIRPVIAVDQHPFRIGPVCRQLQSLWNSQLI